VEDKIDQMLETKKQLAGDFLRACLSGPVADPYLIPQ
jgi:hypothetical protein